VTDDQSLVRATRGTILNLAGAGLTTIAGFGAVWVVSREFGRASTGALFTAVGLFTILAGVAKLGTESATTWYVATSRDVDRAVVKDVVVSALLRVAVVAAVLGLVLVALSSPLASLLVDDPALERDFRSMLVVFGCAVPAWATAQASYGISRGFGSMRVSVVAGSIVRPLVLIAGLVALVVVTDALWPLALAWAGAGVAALAVSLRWVRGALGPASSTASTERRRFWSYTRPRAGADVLHSILERSDLVLLSALAGSAAAGGFAAAARLVLMGQLLLLAVSQAVAPFVGTYLSEGRSRDADELVRTLTTWSVLVTWPPMVVLVLHAPAVTALFGDDFTAAAPLLQVMAAGLALMAVLGPGDIVLLMTGDSHGSLWNHAIALVVMLVVSLTAVPLIGAIGAALAWAGSRLVMRALGVWRIRRATGMQCVDRSALVAMCATLSAYLPVWALTWRLGIGGISALALTTGAGTVVLGVFVSWRRRALLLDRIPGVVRHRRAQPVGA
jgi:O-antigen/teichoic acid export membrane protein